MLNIDVRVAIEAKAPGFFDRWPQFLSNAILRVLERILHVDELHDFFEKHGEKTSWEFIEAVFDYLNFSYAVAEEAITKIPATGRLICVANHGNGPLDGLIFLHLIGKVRQDVKIVVSDLLADLDQLHDLFLLYDQYASGMQRKNLLALKKSLLAEQVILFFPAGQVTKLSRQGFRERKWQNGPVSLACKYATPILPMHIAATNSMFYYVTALINKHFSTLLLPHEMFRKRDKTIRVSIGDLFLTTVFTDSRTDVSAQAQMLREYVHTMGR